MSVAARGWANAIDEAIATVGDPADAPANSADRPNLRAQSELGDEVELRGAEVDRLAIRVDALRARAQSRASMPLARQAEHLARVLPEALTGPLEPVEVDEALGSAILRTPAGAMRQGRFWQVDVDATGSVEVVRHAVRDGERTVAPFVVSREALPDLCRVLTGSLGVRYSHFTLSSGKCEVRIPDPNRACPHGVHLPQPRHAATRDRTKG